MKKIFIKTYGCAVNQSDSELMAGFIQKSGRYKIVNSEKDADVIIVNSCTVKQSSETHFKKYIRNIANKVIILAGCIPQAEFNKQKYEKYSIIGTSNITKVVDVIDETHAGNIVHYLSRELNPRLNLPKIRKNNVIEIIPVAEGCLGNCAYCKVKQARGNLLSYDTKAIIKQIRSALHEGVKEIWLTSQDMGCYGHDIGTNLSELLEEVVKTPGHFFLRVGMANPNHVLPILTDLVKIYKNPKVFKFLHIPVQSGNNRILKLMNRQYSVEDYKHIIYEFRKGIPDITISTDIICGFPTETKKEFKDSLTLIEETKPDVLNISRFWPRPNTLAEKMNQVPGWETKNRSRELNLVFDKIAFENNKKWLGWKGLALIDDAGKNNTSIGRNFAYKQVILKGKYNLGEELVVSIGSVTKHDLRAK